MVGSTYFPNWARAMAKIPALQLCHFPHGLNPFRTITRTDKRTIFFLYNPHGNLRSECNWDARLFKGAPRQVGSCLCAFFAGGAPTKDLTNYHSGPLERELVRCGSIPLIFLLRIHCNLLPHFVRPLLTLSQFEPLFPSVL